MSPLRNAFEDLATEDSLAHVKNRFAPALRTTEAVSVAAAGDNTVKTPAAGKRLRVHWVGLSTSQDNTAETLATVKFGPAGTARYLWNMGNPGGFSHWETLEGAVNEALVVGLSVAQPVQVNVTYEEVV
jgi:hypothetical protein